MRAEDKRNMTIVVFGTAILLLAMLAIANATDGWRKYAELWKGYEITPEIRSWMNSVHSKRSGIGCCGVADGLPVEWEIRDGHYWANYDGGWHPIPDNAVIEKSPAKFPVIWLTPAHIFLEGEDMGYRDVRCFWPGPTA